MDADLRRDPLAGGTRLDARFVDPTLAKAFDEAVAQACEQACIDGFAIGRAEGLEVGRAEGAAALDRECVNARDAEQLRRAAASSALAALDAGAKALSELQLATLADVEDLLLCAAYDLATALLGRELEAVASPVRDSVRRALTMLPDDVVVTIRVNPVDAATLGDLTQLAPGRTVRIDPDPDVEPGSCLADAGATHVDASLAAALRRVREALTT